eukprot:jgi/Tetstr1/465850/TSEL_010470.t1
MDGAGRDTWQMFTHMVEDFNRNMMMLLMIGVFITLDEAMSAYLPLRSTKTGGLPHISFIKRKPKPLGTKGKATCDCETRVMIHFEIQEGRDALRQKEHAPGLRVTAACTSRMDVVSPYFARSPRVDNHNQSRHHDLVLEELWLTQDCWLRMHTTMAGIHVTNCWKLVKHHLPRHHPLKESTVVNFADPMCKAMIYNGLTGKVEPSRLTERVLADITNEPPPLRHNIMHPGKRPGNDNATTQARCTIYELAVYGVNRRTD